MMENIDRSNWQIHRFDEIASSISEKVDPTNTDLEIYVGLEHIDPESIHIKRYGQQGDVKGTKLRCYPGDIIFGRRRAYQRKAAIVDFDGFCSAHSLVLRANQKNIDPKLLPFFLHSDIFMHRAVDISVGSLSPTINWKTLKQQEFLLPPKDQQARIAELLWAMDDAVEKEKRIKDKLNVYKNSTLKKYFMKSNEKIKIKNFGEVITGATPSTKVTEYWNGNIPFITPTDIDDNIFISNTERNITEKGLEVTRKIPENSVMVVCIASIGKISISKSTSATNQQINTIIPNKIFNFLYIYYTIKYFINKLISVAGHSVVPIINKNDFQNIKVPLINKLERTKLVEDMLIIDKVTFKSKIKINKSFQLQKSLINEIFA